MGKKRKPVRSKRDIRQEYIRALACLDQERPEIFSNLVKNFFRDFFRIKYETTFEELVEFAMKKHLDPEITGQITKLLSELSEYEFKTGTKDFDIGYLKFSFEKILNQLTSHREPIISKKKTKNAFSKAYQFLVCILRVLKKEPLSLEHRIEICKLQIQKGDLIDARKSYMKAIKLYKNSSEDVKERNYDSLRELREALLGH